MTTLRPVYHAHQINSYPPPASPIPTTSMEGILLRLSNSIDKLEKRFVNTDSDSHTELEWKKVSLVVDRICLLVFFLAMTIASLAILTSSPHIYTASLSDLRQAGIINESTSENNEENNVSAFQQPCRRGDD